MGIRGVSHIAVGVRDMDAALVFWRDVVGLEVRFDETEEFGTPGGGFYTKRRGVYLRYGSGDDDSFVVLDQQLSKAPWGRPLELFETGIHHVGLWVDDVDAIAERAIAAGFEPMFKPSNADSKDYGEPSGRTIRTMFLNGPDATIVQFDQRVS